MSLINGDGNPIVVERHWNSLLFMSVSDEEENCHCVYILLSYDYSILMRYMDHVFSFSSRSVMFSVALLSLKAPSCHLSTQLTFYFIFLALDGLASFTQVYLSHVKYIHR